MAAIPLRVFVVHSFLCKLNCNIFHSLKEVFSSLVGFGAKLEILKFGQQCLFVFMEFFESRPE